MIACDLWSLPGGLADRVSEILSSNSVTRHLGRSRLVIAATHTHQSPGNFSSARTYNSFSSPVGGFDAGLFDFLAHRISTAGLTAVQMRRSAVLQWSEGIVGGLMHNRSLNPFLRNAEHGDILWRNRNLPVAGLPLFGSETEYRAVDPRVTVLTLVSAEKPEAVIGIASFVAVHPTAMSAHTPIYSSDLFGVAATLAERSLSRGGHSVPGVVAMFNGTEGDVSPAWRTQDRSDAVALGTRLADAVMRLVGRGSVLDGRILARFARVSMARACLSDEGAAVARPLPGVALLGGAEDGRTFLHAWGWREGVTGRPIPCHGSKRPALDRVLPLPWPFSLTARVSTPSSFPGSVPIGVYAIGPLAIATLPGEFTVTLGQRIERQIAGAITPTPERVLLIGLANEYLSYFTTPEEYHLQHYEGASTMFGPGSGPLIARELGSLAARLHEPALPSGPETFTYHPGPERRFTPEWAGQLSGARDELDAVLRDRVTGVVLDDVPMFCWTDLNRALTEHYVAGLRVTPRVSVVEASDSGPGRPLLVDGVPEDDTSGEFVTIAGDADGPTARWCVFWMRPRGEWGVARLRLRIETIGGTELFSPPLVPPMANVSGTELRTER